MDGWVVWERSEYLQHGLVGERADYLQQGWAGLPRALGLVLLPAISRYSLPVLGLSNHSMGSGIEKDLPMGTWVTAESAITSLWHLDWDGSQGEPLLTLLGARPGASLRGSSGRPGKMPNERQQESLDTQICDQPLDSAVWEAQED